MMTIGEASTHSGVPAKTIRYYEQIGLLGPPIRGPNLYRTYHERDVAILRFIGRARRLGFSIQDLKNLVALYRDRTRSSRDVKRVAELHLARVERKIRDLQSLRSALADLIERCAGDNRPDCPIMDDLEASDATLVRRSVSAGAHKVSPAPDRARVLVRH
jgi:MerR family copper efflux transcriptional regulator